MAGVGMPAVLLLKSVDASVDRRMAAFSKAPRVTNDIEYFKQKIQTITSADDLLKDYRLKTFVLKAFGLEESVNQTALIKKVLTDDLTKEDAFARRMNDKRFVTMATTLRLDEDAEFIKNSKVVEAVVTRYLQQGFEQDIGDQNINVREAMYFRRNIKDVENIYQVMADKVLRAIVMDVDGIPQETAKLSFEQQEKIWQDKVDVKKFKDPAEVEKYIQRYLIKKDAETSSANNPILSLFMPADPSQGFSIDLMI